LYEGMFISVLLLSFDFLSVVEGLSSFFNGFDDVMK
jgi:hypothetical protein